MFRFPKSASSSSWQKSDSVIDVLLPRYYEYELDTPDHFQDNLCRSKELEHDDGDTLYAEALLNSDFLAWLNSDETDTSTTSSTTSTSNNTSTALERLRMLVAHASPTSLLPPPTFHHDPKGKGKGRQT